MKRVLTIVFFLCLSLPVIWAQEGRRSEHKVFDDADRVAVMITYTYDSAGVVETRRLQSFDRQGRLTRTELYSVDEQLLFTEVIRYNRHGYRSRCTQTTYDEEGHATRSDFRYKYEGPVLVCIRLNGEVVYRVP